MAVHREGVKWIVQYQGRRTEGQTWEEAYWLALTPAPADTRARPTIS